MSLDALREKKIAVLMGGISSEREVSLKTGAGVVAALRERGWNVVAIDWKAGDDVAALLVDNGTEVVWNALHGTFGEDGGVQGLCACLGIGCTGSGILASALAMDKVAAKRIFESHGIATPAWKLVERAAEPATALEGWGYPLVIKPAAEGSSVGVSIVHSENEIEQALLSARSHHGPTLVEAFIDGPELHVGILDGKVLGTVEVRPKSGFYDYEAKYLRSDTEYLVPPPIDAAVLGRAEALALEAYVALGCAGHGRTDVRVNRQGEPFILEVNTLPGMTATSLLPKIAAWAGMSYGELCERVLASTST